MAVDYLSMTEEQISIINEYCENDMKKLKQICYTVWGKKGLPTCYNDDLYDDAMNVLSESVITFNQNGTASFKTYLTNNIRMSYGQWYRDNFLRAKRNNLELDEKGNIKKDENENPIIIPNISFDAPAEDGIDLCEKISSDFNIDDEQMPTLILSHKPEDTKYFNIHGHIHDEPLEKQYPNLNKESHFCVSVEMTNYEPISIEEIKNKIKGEN